MYSINFPEMVSGGKTFIAEDHQATINNLTLALKTCTRNTLFGDPYYGNNLMQILFAQNNIFLEDIVKDEIYTCIQEYLPQLQLTREDISLDFNGSTLNVAIKALNILNSTLDLYTIKLVDIETD